MFSAPGVACPARHFRVIPHTVSQALVFYKPFIINSRRLVVAVRFHRSPVGRYAMIAVLQLVILAIITVFAVAAAAALHWLFLKAAFVMMRPATARRIPLRTELVHGTSQLARAFASPR